MAGREFAAAQAIVGQTTCNCRPRPLTWEKQSGIINYTSDNVSRDTCLSSGASLAELGKTALVNVNVGKPITRYRPNARGARQYRALAQELVRNEQ